MNALEIQKSSIKCLNMLNDGNLTSQQLSEIADLICDCEESIENLEGVFELKKFLSHVNEQFFNYGV